MQPVQKKHLFASLFLGTALCVFGTSAQAEQASVKAVFDVSMAGVSIGKGNLTANLNSQGYSIGVAAKVTGIARVISSGEGTATAQGRLTGHNLVPISYGINNTVDTLKNSVSLRMKNNLIVNESVIPPTPYNAARVPVTDAVKRGVIDPLSAFLVPSEGDTPLSAENCNRTLKIYDGRQRYDIAMAYGRTEQVQSVGDLGGSSLVCKAAWRPIAGHKAENAETSHMEENRDVEATLTPIAGTPYLMISRITVGTSFGKLIINAKRVSVMHGQQASLEE